jgi:hypothetical protein
MAVCGIRINISLDWLVLWVAWFRHLLSLSDHIFLVCFFLMEPRSMRTNSRPCWELAMLVMMSFYLFLSHKWMVPLGVNKWQKSSSGNFLMLPASFLHKVRGFQTIISAFLLWTRSYLVFLFKPQTSILLLIWSTILLFCRVLVSNSLGLIIRVITMLLSTSKTIKP